MYPVKKVVEPRDEHEVQTGRHVLEEIEYRLVDPWRSHEMVVIQYEVRFFGDSIEALDDKGESLFDGEPLLSLEKGPQSLSERLAFLRKARKEIAEEEVSFVVGPVEGVPYSVQSLLSNPLAGQRGLPGARWSCDEDQPAFSLPESFSKRRLRSTILARRGGMWSFVVTSMASQP